MILTTVFQLLIFFLADEVLTESFAEAISADYQLQVHVLIPFEIDTTSIESSALVVESQVSCKKTRVADEVGVMIICIQLMWIIRIIVGVAIRVIVAIWIAGTITTSSTHQ
ncbi:hypothetical protein B0T22DRAFT_471940 [Podospora appendiculata]|uniref:Secreted protein n=1 Tax=Podospora appendiculata TaxID=314037 RepID=A0AAE1C8E4_9PEZI|nr:hypothetical protein B0T22DRAFT_471940 [Podospora appendiculata]